MSDKQQSPYEELSYYGLSLLSYLRDSHPLLAADTSFIADRADRAAEAYSDAIRAGSTHAEAEAAASDELYRRLHFSPYNTLVHILWDEFASEVPEEAARAGRTPASCSARYSATCWRSTTLRTISPRHRNTPSSTPSL